MATECAGRRRRGCLTLLPASICSESGYIRALLRREFGRTGWATMLTSFPGPLGPFRFFLLLNVAGGNVHHQLSELVGIAWAFQLSHGWSVPMTPVGCQLGSVSN